MAVERIESIFKKICRLCLNGGELTPISGKMVSAVADDISAVVSDFTNTQVSTNDGLPQLVCRICLRRLKTALDFRKMCSDNNKKLRKTLAYVQHLQAVEGDIFRKHFPDVEEADDVKWESGEDEDILWHDNIFSETAEDSDGVTKDSASEENQDSVAIEAAIFRKHFPEVIDKKVSPVEKRAPAPPGYDRRGRPKTKWKDNATETQFRMTKKEKRDARKLIVEAVKLKRCKEKCQKKQRKVARYKDALDGEYTPNGPVNCKICGKRLSNVQSLRLHAQVHFGFNFICELCGKGCRSYASLDQHFMIRHGRERRLPCHQCSYRAVNNAELRIHERTHTGERPYQCDQCGLSFHRRLCLVMHVKGHNNKMYKCDRCPKAYVQSSGLKLHINNVHDRQFVYKCHICDQSYSRTISVRKHLEEKHGLAREKQGHIKKINVL